MSRSQSANGSRAFIYARVSSREQQEEGYSIEAQLRLLREYADKHEIEVIREFTDVETAKEAGRTNFGVMLQELQQQPERERTILVEKTDRLYRNFYDMVKVDALKPAIHFVKDGAVLSEDSRSSDKFMHNIKVAVAKHYVDNLSEEVKKGYLEKARSGWWPSKAPLGYRTATLNGKKVVEIDPEDGPKVRRLFERYSLGTCSITELAEVAKEMGLRTCKGSIVSRPNVYFMLRSIFYVGRFKFKGEVYQGNHEPLISWELFHKVQAALKRDGKPNYRTKRELTFIGLVQCHMCGCKVTGEIKRYGHIYYHCTGYRGGCEKPYIREEKLDELMFGAVKAVEIDKETGQFLREAVHEGCKDDQELRRATASELQSQRDVLEKRMKRLYEDKQDGKVSERFWEQMQAQYSAQVAEIERQLERAQRNQGPYYESVYRTIELAQAAPALYSHHDGPEKRRLLRTILSKTTFDGARLHPVYAQPFSTFAKMGGSLIERGRRDSNSRSPA